MIFSFTGKLQFNSDEGNNPWLKEGNGYKRFNCAVVGDYGNRGYVELTGFGRPKDGKVKTFNKDGEKMTVDWDSRLDHDLIYDVAGYMTYRANVGESATFITDYDMVERLAELKKTGMFDGKNITITGRVVKSLYNGTLRTNYQIRSVFESQRERKHIIQGEIYYTADGFDLSEWKDGRVILNCYTNEYINKEYGRRFVPLTLIYEGNDDWDLKQLGINIENGRPVVALKKRKVYKQSVICDYFNGTESREFSEADLTENQRRGIAAGKLKFEDCVPRGGGRVFGQRVQTIKVTGFYTAGIYADGIVEDEIKIDEFNDMIFVSKEPATPEAQKETKVEDDGVPFDEANDDDMFSS